MFLDTSGLLCLHHIDEFQHSDALTLFEATERKLTHGYVLAEFVILAKVRGLPRRETISFASALLNHPEVEVVWVDEALHRQAMDLLEARLDKGYSLCDAVSFVLMKKRGMIDALTTDHHFEQEGLIRLLRP
jgi:predicted nucleic acid-binding protein